MTTEHFKEQFDNFPYYVMFGRLVCPCQYCTKHSAWQFQPAVYNIRGKILELPYEILYLKIKPCISCQLSLIQGFVWGFFWISCQWLVLLSCLTIPYTPLTRKMRLNYKIWFGHLNSTFFCIKITNANLTPIYYKHPFLWSRTVNFSKSLRRM